MALQASRPSKKKNIKSLSALNSGTPTKRFNAEIPAELMVELKIRAAKEEITLTELAQRAFNGYLSN